MNKNDAEKIIKDEKLMHYNWFNDHEVYSKEVNIQKIDEGWSVFTADERGSKISEVIYKNESDALINFIKRLRADKILNNLY